MEGVIKIKVDTRWAMEIFQGRKSVEIRKANEKWNAIEIGSVVSIEDSTTGVERFYRILDVRRYKSLSEALVKEGLRNVLPDIETLEDACKTYCDFDKSYATSPVLAFELKPSQISKVKRSESEMMGYLKQHVMGAVESTEYPDCTHEKLVYNDDTMGGSGSTWESYCERCKKTFY